MNTTAQTSQLAWLLDSLIKRIPETRHAIVLSDDGLLLAASADLPRADAEHLAAVSSGLQSLAHGTSRQFNGGQVRQTLIEMDEVILLVTNAGRGARMAVIATSAVDIGAVGYEMTMLVRQVGQFLTAAPRQVGVGPGQQGPYVGGEHG